MKNLCCLLTLFAPSGAEVLVNLSVATERPAASYPGFSKLLSSVFEMGTDTQGT